MLLSLWRIDAPWLVALFMAFVAFERRFRFQRADLVVLAIVAGTYAIYTVFRFMYFGDLLPNTFHAKISIDPSLSGGWPYLQRFFSAHGSLFVIVPAVVLGFFARNPLERLAAFLTVGQITYVALVQGDWIPGFRFLMPILPFLVLLISRLLLRLLQIPPPILGQIVTLAAFAALSTGFVIKPAQDYIDPGMRSPLSWLRHPTFVPAELVPCTESPDGSTRPSVPTRLLRLLTAALFHTSPTDTQSTLLAFAHLRSHIWKALIATDGGFAQR